jgi:hypothetical protein
MRFHQFGMLLGAMSLMLLTGCTFCRLQGTGPVGRENYSSYLQPASTQQMEEYKKEVDSLKFPWGPRTMKVRYGPFTGYTQHIGQTLNWHYLAGPSRVRTLYEPADETKRAVLETFENWGISFPLFSLMNVSFYDAQTGECISRSKATILTTFIVYASATSPTGKGGDVSPESLEKKIAIDTVKYDHMSGWCLAWGVLAWGQKNNRAYFQIAWIPIPLWSWD